MKQPMSFKNQLFIGTGILILISIIVGFIINYEVEYSNYADLTGKRLREVAKIYTNEITLVVKEFEVLKNINNSQELYSFKGFSELQALISNCAKTFTEDEDINITEKNVFIVRMKPKATQSKEKEDLNLVPIFTMFANEEFGIVGEVYDTSEELNKHLMNVYNNNISTYTEIYKEENISYISAFSPILDKSKKNIGILCLRVPTTEFYLKMNSLILLNILVLLFLFGLAYIICLYITRKYKNGIKVLVNKIEDSLKSEKQIEFLKIKIQTELQEVVFVINKVLDKFSLSVMSEKFLDSIIRSFKDTIVITDKDGKIILFSNSLLKLLHYSEEEIMNEPISKILVDNYENPEELRFFDMLDHLRMFEYDVEYKSKAGELIPVTFCGIPMKSDDNIIGCIGVARDTRLIHGFIKELENSKRTLKNKTNDQNALNRELQALKRKIEKESKAMEVFYKERDEINNNFLQNIQPNFISMVEIINEMLNTNNSSDYYSILANKLKLLVSDVKSLGQFLNDIVALISKEQKK